MNFRELVQVSRPRFRLYTAGPFVVGVAAAGFFGSFAAGGNEGLQGTTLFVNALYILSFLLYLGMFLFPVNLLIYGVNDIADEDTDSLNEKKQGYEGMLGQQHTGTLKYAIRKRQIGGHLLFLVIWFFLFVLITVQNTAEGASLSMSDIWQLPVAFLMMTIRVWFLGWITWIAFYLSSIYYSLPPIRAKARPFLDGLFNVLYILPGIIGYLFFGGMVSELSRSGIFAGWLRCIAMHCYSAIPDIEPDSQAGITTTAVYLGKTGALLYCGILWILAAFFAYPTIGWISILGALVYAIMIGLSFSKNIFTLYTLFPWINAIIGMLLFFLFL